MVNHHFKGHFVRKFRRNTHTADRLPYTAAKTIGDKFFLELFRGERYVQVLLYATICIGN